MQLKRILIIVLILFLSLISISVYYAIEGTPWGKSRFKDEVGKYINHKYGQEVIFHSDASYGFDVGIYSILVSLINDKTTKFIVYQDQTDKENLVDDYFIKYWNKKISEEIDMFVSRIYQGTDVSIFYSIHSYTQEDLNFSNYEDVKELLEEVSIEIQIKQTYGSEGEEQDNKKILSIFDYIQMSRYKHSKISIHYTPINKEGILTSLEVYEAELHSINLENIASYVKVKKK